MENTKNSSLNLLLDLLKASGADAWEVTDREETGWEFYFIRHRLDQHRAKNVRSFSVTVYRRFDSFLGSAKAKIACDAS